MTEGGGRGRGGTRGDIRVVGGQSIEKQEEINVSKRNALVGDAVHD